MILGLVRRVKMLAIESYLLYCIGIPRALAVVIQLIKIPFTYIFLYSFRWL